jgi:hypothetical protein
MARDRDRNPDDDDDDQPSDWEDSDDPIDTDMDDERADYDADDTVLPCPYCGKDVYEGAEQCPHCKGYISEEDAPPPATSVGRFPRWLVIVIVLALVAVFSGVIAMW